MAWPGCPGCKRNQRCPPGAITPVLGPVTRETAKFGALPVAVAAEVKEIIRIIAAAAKTAAMSHKKTLNEIGIKVSGCIINNLFPSNKAC
jgi:hypothetical protein